MGSWVYAIMVLKTLEDVTCAKCDHLWGIVVPAVYSEIHFSMGHVDFIYSLCEMFEINLYIYIYIIFYCKVLLNIT